MIRIVVATSCLLNACNVVRGNDPPKAAGNETTEGIDDAGTVSMALAAPVHEVHVTHAGLVVENLKFLWIRSHDPLDSIQVIEGAIVQSTQQYGLQWLYFVNSECMTWNAGATGCLASTTQLEMTSDIDYDIVGWTEAENRQVPERELILIAEDWPFNPADLNMNGVVDCCHRTRHDLS